VSDAELERIRKEYRVRDAGKTSPYRWDNPGYIVYMQALEREVLRGLSDAGVGLDGARVLDVGCGTAYLLHRLREYGAGECHGIDLLEDRIADGHRRYPGLVLHVGSATDLPFDDGYFDLVTQFTCLSSILDDDVRSKATHEMLRVTSGWLLSVDMRSGGVPHHGTPTVGLDDQELIRLFGEPALLRRVLPRFDLIQRTGRHDLLGRALGTLKPLRSYYLGLWKVRPQRGHTVDAH